MNIKKLGTAIIGLGVTGLAASILVDILRTGTLKIQSAQILLIEISLITIALGIFARQLSDKHETGNFSLSGLTNWIKELPLITWVFTGFFTTYLAFFISPMFFRRPPRILYFNKYLPDMYPIGFDLKFLADLIRQWLESGQTPFYSTVYPPFTYVLFSPLTLIQDPNTLYKIVSLITIICFILAALIIPTLIAGKSDKNIILLLAVTGLVSYGMQFELERGQFNVITIMFAMAAVYIYHHHHDYRRYAYILFSMAVQLKIYPAIFAVMFIRDWKDWKGNLSRLFIFASGNFLLLFIMGWDAFIEFIHKVQEQLLQPTLSWTGNHSIKAFFTEFVENDGYGIANARIIDFINRYNGIISTLFLLLFLLCFIDIVIRAYHENNLALNTNLLLVVTLGALIIPVSNDYTLPILVGPMALALTSLVNSKYGKRKTTAALLVMISSAAYSSILYPFKYRAVLIQNAFPFLFIILISTTILNRLILPRVKQTNESTERLT